MRLSNTNKGNNYSNIIIFSIHFILTCFLIKETTNQDNISNKTPNTSEQMQNSMNEKYLELTNFDSLPLIDQIDSIKCSSRRLISIREALEEPDAEFFNLVSPDNLKKNLDFIIKVLQNVLEDERKYKKKFNLVNINSII
jgi:hypothetical protein